MNKLPTSIKIIGWLYTLMGLIIAGFFLFVLYSTTANPPEEAVKFTSQQTSTFAILAIIYGLCISITGQGILRKNNIIWYISFVLILPFITNPFFVLLSIFFVWKLIQHRKYFKINWF